MVFRPLHMAYRHLHADPALPVSSRTHLREVVVLTAQVVATIELDGDGTLMCPSPVRRTAMHLSAQWILVQTAGQTGILHLEPKLLTMTAWCFLVMVWQVMGRF